MSAVRAVKYYAPDTGDAIISDLHRIRESLVEKFNGDLAALTADAQRRQLASGRKIVRRAKPTVGARKASV
jgi:hypothetical protein